MWLYSSQHSYFLVQKLFPTVLWISVICFDIVFLNCYRNFRKNKVKSYNVHKLFALATLHAAVVTFILQPSLGFPYMSLSSECLVLYSWVMSSVSKLGKCDFSYCDDNVTPYALVIIFQKVLNDFVYFLLYILTRPDRRWPYLRSVKHVKLKWLLHFLKF